MVARMSRSLVVCAAAAAALLGAGCGPKIPQHAGYKSKKAQPWLKAKAIALKNNEGQVEGDLAYADYRRAKWWAIDLPTDGEMTVTLEQSSSADRPSDIALEVLDPTYQVIVRADKEEEDALEGEKTRALYELRAGHYLVHLYLQGRLDAAEYELRVKFTPKEIATAPSAADVAFLPDLPVVPIVDDTPVRPKPRNPRRDEPRPTQPTTPTTPTTTATGPIQGRVNGVEVGNGGTKITIGRGTEAGVQPGMKGRVVGLAKGDFVVESCGAKECKATVKGASVDEVLRSKKVVINE